MARYIDAEIFRGKHEVAEVNGKLSSVILYGDIVNAPTADVVSRDQIIELKCALDKAIEGKHKYGVLYEELLEEKANLENEIQHLTGMVEAFKLVLGCEGD